MRLAARLRSWLRSVTRRSRFEADMHHELEFHIERRTEHLIRAGLSPEPARRQARAELGSLAARKDEIRDALGLRLLDNLRADLLHACRQMRKAPGVTAVAILSMALGIGATAAVYSVVHAVLIDTHPYRDSGRIVHYTDLASATTFEQWRKLPAFEDVIATDIYTMSLTSADPPEAVDVGRVSSNAFEFFGVPPVLGRAFRPEDETKQTAALTYDFWQSHYGRDPGVIGRILQLDHKPYTIIAVVPPRLRWKRSEIFIPADLSFYRSPSLELAGRLKSGARVEQAEAQALADIKQRVATLPAGYRVRFQDLKDRSTRSLRETLLLFLVAVFVLLAVACANVSILLLARGTTRLHEMALRAAIGAGRGRLIAQLLTEALLLTIAGGFLGVLAAYGGLGAILGWLPAETLPPESAVQVSLPVLIVSSAAAMLAGLLAGLAPAIRFSLPRLHELMLAAGRRLTGTRSAHRAQHVLVAAQVALTVMLLTGAGAAIRALTALYHTNPGYDPANVVRATIPTPEGSYPTWEERKAFFQSVITRVSSLPQAESVAVGPFFPPFGGSTVPFEIPGLAPDAGRRILAQLVSSEYFSALRIPVLQGRVWTDAETDRAAPLAVINQELARRYWPEEDPLGKRLRLPSLQPGQWIRTPAWSTDWLEVVGVAGNVRNRDLHQPTVPGIYVPYTLSVADNMGFIVRARNPLDLVASIRAEVHAVAPGQPITGVATGEEVLRRIGWRREEVASTLFAIFAGLALALAAVGLYSAVTYATALLTQEFGIRMALGARKADVVRLVLRPAAATVSAGIALGLPASLASNRLLASWTTATVYDPWVLGSVIAVLIGVAAAAAFIPALRASATDPAVALRE